MAVLNRGIESAHKNVRVHVFFMYSIQILLSRGFSYQQTDHNITVFQHLFYNKIENIIFVIYIETNRLQSSSVDLVAT